MMDENKEDAETKAVQTDTESQEFGSQHGQDTQGRETGSSSPTATAQAFEGADDDTIPGIGDTRSGA